MALTLDVAQRLIREGLGKAESLGVSVSIAVTDAAGWLVAVVRMDGAGLPTTEIAFGKAAAAALMRRSGAEMASRWGPGHPIMTNMAVRTGGHFVASQGGLPLREANVVVGGIGVSGGTAQQDEEIAQAAIDAVGPSA
jgi:uncharacterized protein GlcG (DUF336 family)